MQKRLDDSRKRFAAYLDSKAKALDAARSRYLEVFKLRSASIALPSTVSASSSSRPQ